jgi:23S rRNA pseudouridine1911/1915/1917 synthase
MTDQKLILNADTPKQRLDKFVLEHVDGLSRTQVQALIREGQITVNGKIEKTGFKFKGGETVNVTIPTVEETTLEPEDIDLDIIYEDDDLAVINKSAGMVVHPGIGHETGTLVNAILARYPELADMFDDPDTQNRLGIVHRLDKGTSGLIVVARNKPTLLHLMNQFQERTVDKVYLALVESTPKSSVGRVEAAISRDPRKRKRMWVHRDGKPAITEFSVIDDHYQGGRAMVRLKLLTGRTHQIRVHMAFIGCPVVGDAIYGRRKQRLKLKRQFLHATELAFDHPTTEERIEFSSPLPSQLQNILDKLR